MRFRLALALSISLLLIGGASWVRYSRASADVYHAPLAVVPTNTQTADHKDLLAASTAISISTSTPTTPDKRTQTDLISRQMMLDYLSLVSSGQATDATINSLAEKYAESIPTLNNAPAINQADIRIVPDTTANFQAYANTMAQVQTAMGEQMDGVENTISLDPQNPNFSPAIATRAQKAYATAAKSLLGLPVPLSLTPSHLKLVNSYLSSAQALTQVTSFNTDIMPAYAGIIIVSDNLNTEAIALNEIAQILTSNDI